MKLQTKESNIKRSTTLKKTHKEKIWGFKTRHSPWNKGLKRYRAGIPRHEYDKQFRKKISDTMIKYYKTHDVWNKGIPMSPLHKEKLRLANLGREQSEETRRKNSEAHTGPKNYKWTGITPLNKLLRSTSKWKIWRELVFLRDNFTCQNPNCEFCHNKIGVFLHPHHIKSIKLYPELVYNIDNGITYCMGYHLKSKLHQEVKNGVTKSIQYCECTYRNKA